MTPNIMTGTAVATHFLGRAPVNERFIHCPYDPSSLARG